MPLSMPSRLPTLVVSLVVNGSIPALAYWSLRSPLHSDVAALAVGAVVPLGWSAVLAGWRRRVDPVALVSLAGLAVAVVVSLSVGGGVLPLLLRHAAVTGVAGTACLVSVAIRRPLLAAARPLLLRSAHRGRRVTGETAGPPSERYFGVLTTIVGVVLLAHALLTVALALTLPTGVYLVASRLAGWAATAIGALAVLWYVRRARRSGTGTGR
jgi:hypothetical protein